MKKVIAIAAFASMAFGANAQNKVSSASQTVKLNLSNAIELTFTGTGDSKGADVNLAFNDVNDYANGVESAAQELKVRSNKNFDVTVKANAASFTYDGSTSPAPVMPVENILGLMVSANGTGGTIGSSFSASKYATLTDKDQSLIADGDRGGNQTFAVKYQATPGFAYPAGTYSVDVVYTATQK